MKSRVMTVVLLLCVAILTVACGGGGGGSNPASSASQGVTVKGRITGEGDLSGIPVYLLGVDAQVPPAASILADNGTVSAGQLYFSMTDGEGTFVFQNVVQGLYNLVAKKDKNHGGIRRNLSITAEASVMPTDLELLLTATGEITGQVQVPSGFSNPGGITAFVPGTSFAAFTDADGKFTISGVPVGTYTISFVAPGLAQSKLENVQVGAGLVTALPLVNLAKDAAYFAGLIWKGELPTAPQNPQDNWAYYNTTDGKAYICYGGSWYVMSKDGQTGPMGPAGPIGATGSTGLQGAAGMSIVWKGSLSVAPSSPSVNWAYYDTTQKRALIWDGDSWEILALDGLIGPQGPVGPQGPQGPQGLPGVSITWKGSSATAPANPQLNWAYYNSTDKRSYIWDGTAWQTLSQDGVAGPTGPQGQPGVGITWKGSLDAAPATPQLNWAYYNTTDRKAYIFDGLAWQVLAQDGSTGAQGVQGNPGVSIAWKGTFDTAPSSPQLNWAYYNSTDRKSYIWDGTAWRVLAVDGMVGPQGPQGISIVWQGWFASEAALEAAKGPKQVNWAYYNTTDRNSYLWDGTTWVLFVPGSDATAPTISGITWQALSASSVRISWTTNEDSTTQVEYGLTTSYGSLSPLVEVYTQNHSIDVTGVSRDLVYHYRIRSKDASGNEAISGDKTFTYTGWTQATAAAPFAVRTGHTSVVFNNKMWVIGGNCGNFPPVYNDVWSSTDGVTWTQETAAGAFPARNGHTSVVYDNKIWVIGGTDGAWRNDVWYSSDGITWTRATAAAAFSPRSEHTSVVFNNKMWVIGGKDSASAVWKNDIWSSTDGVTWTCETPAAAFPGRSEHTSVVFNNKMWVIAGWSGAVRNDVWSSSDGVTWTQQTAAAAFPARELFSSVVFNGQMWVIGGKGTVWLNDSWSSSDGVTWVNQTPPLVFPVRDLHSSVVFNNKMWVIGGYDGACKNDVWWWQ